MSDAVLIRGGGIAACCCARLLSKGGVRVFVEQGSRQASPTLMLSDQTQLLLRDVFGAGDLFQDARKITKRIVAWGPVAEPLTLPHSGVATAEARLLDKLWPMVGVEIACEDAPDWSVCCSRSAIPPVSHFQFGARMAVSNTVDLNTSLATDCCWVEATRSGWLFLVPGSLISVGGKPEVLLQESRLVAQHVSTLGPQLGCFPAFPRIVKPLCGPHWIACGSAAIGFDPIAGEGAGHAVRQGILTAAVIRAAIRGEPEHALFAHYTSRMMSGFVRHLNEVASFYNGDFGPWWEGELRVLKEAVDAARLQFATERSGVYKLVDFELQPV